MTGSGFLNNSVVALTSVRDIETILTYKLIQRYGNNGLTWRRCRQAKDGGLAYGSNDVGCVNEAALRRTRLILHCIVR